MGKLEKIMLWVSVVIALIALILAITNFIRINHNDKIVNAIAETQGYIIEWVK
ncbi:hypothetical protein ES707_12918 [subsurface metagenome]